MSDSPVVRCLSGVVLDAADPRALADFYQALLGWTRTQDEDDWVKLMPPGGDPLATGIGFQEEPRHRSPTWPSGAAEQMQLHLDFYVADLDVALEHALAVGAQLALVQPQEHVRVLLDPVGHPFCLFDDEG